MRPSLILQASEKPILILQLVLAAYLLFRGHNQPGGGFSAGLLAAASFSFIAICRSVADVRKIMRFSPLAYIALGLLISILSALIGPVFFREPFLTGIWGWSIPLPPLGSLSLGTPLLFDIGVFFVVFGSVLLILLSLFDQGHGSRKTGSSPPSRQEGLR